MRKFKNSLNFLLFSLKKQGKMGRGNGTEQRSSGSFEYSLDFLSLSLKTIELKNSVYE